MVGAAGSFTVRTEGGALHAWGKSVLGDGSLDGVLEEASEAKIVRIVTAPVIFPATAFTFIIIIVTIAVDMRHFGNGL